MITEKICTYEVCKLAKEKGFDVPTRTVKVEKIEGTEKEVWDEEECRYVPQWEIRSLRIPTQSLLQRWLREEKGVTICVDIFDDGWFFDISTFYKQDTGIYEVDIPYKSSNVSPVYDTYELALEDALKYALENLV